MTWNRYEIKQNAKTALRHSYWVAFAVTQTVVILTSMLSFKGYSQTLSDWYSTWPAGDYWHFTLTWATGLSLVFGVFVSNILRIGRCRFFVRNRYGESRYEMIFSGFRANGYLNCVAAGFITGLIIRLWALLFVIPGIYKGYQYFFVNYLLSDNPKLNGSRARELSRMLTDGNKWDIFVMEISFVGWYILGALCLGVGLFFVAPYPEAAFAELYIQLRDNAIRNNWFGAEELGLNAGAYAQTYRS